MSTRLLRSVTRGGYRLDVFKDALHELHTAGEHGYFVGYVSDPENLDTAIDAAEEEMRYLMAEARAEFA